VPYEVTIQRVEPQITAVVRFRAVRDRLSTDVPKACGEVWAYIQAEKLPGAGRHVALYLDDCTNVEVGAEISQPFPGNGRVVCSSLPAGLVATTAHIGPYAGLSAAHGAVSHWCSANGRKFAGPSWEIYGHWTDDPTQIRTDVFYLLA
jgi:effector-binding domain-containing protein